MTVTQQVREINAHIGPDHRRSVYGTVRYGTGQEAWVRITRARSRNGVLWVRVLPSGEWVPCSAYELQ